MAWATICSMLTGVNVGMPGDMLVILSVEAFDTGAALG